MGELIDRISEFVSKDTVTVELRLPAARADLLAKLYREGTQGAIHYEGEWTYVTATMPTRALDQYGAFLVGGAGTAARGSFLTAD
jgi:50S ribosomal subunit-associated GTPase HflX